MQTSAPAAEPETKLKLYLAGAMSGIPKFNFPAFDRWQRRLVELGYDVFSPHEDNPDEVIRLAWQSPDGDPASLPESDMADIAIRNVNGVIRCDGVALIDGWQGSLGTAHEIATAHRFKIPVAPVWMWVAADPYAVVHIRRYYGGDWSHQ